MLHLQFLTRHIVLLPLFYILVSSSSSSCKLIQSYENNKHSDYKKSYDNMSKEQLEFNKLKMLFVHYVLGD